MNYRCFACPGPGASEIRPGHWSAPALASASAKLRDGKAVVTFFEVRRSSKGRDPSAAGFGTVRCRTPPARSPREARRTIGPVDLLIAATAERERLTLLSDDHDFTAIAQVTGQPVKLVTDA